MSEAIAQSGAPQAGEYTQGQQLYIALAEQASDLIAQLEEQPDRYRRLVSTLTEEAAGTRPAPREWSVKEVIGHVADAERVFAYRCIALARGEQNPLPPFDQDDWVALGHFNLRSLASLLDEFDLQRRANLLALRSLDGDALLRAGTISDYHQSVRALIFVMAGHAQHHILSLETDYGLG